MKVSAVGRPEVPVLEMPSRFRHDIAYFMTPSGEHGAPRLASGEYWIDAADARRWLDEGVVGVISPLDTEKTAELEITEEQEDWLTWLVEHNIQHVRLDP